MAKKNKDLVKEIPAIKQIIEFLEGEFPLLNPKDMKKFKAFHTKEGFVVENEHIDKFWQIMVTDIYVYQSQEFKDCCEAIRIGFPNIDLLFLWRYGVTCNIFKEKHRSKGIFVGF